MNTATTEEVVLAETEAQREAFIREYTLQTHPHPWTRGTRVFTIKHPDGDDYVLFEVKHFDKKICFDYIGSSDKRRGNGSNALAWLLRLADRHGVTLHGHVQPVGKAPDRLRFNELCAWYKRHGFAVTKRDVLTYTPKLKPKGI